MNLIAYKLFLLLISLFNVKCANILGLMGVPSPSHQIWNSVLYDALANRGHNLTILSVDLPKNFNNVPKNVHYIHLEETYNSLYNETYDETALKVIDLIGNGPITGMKLFYDFGIKSLLGIMKSKGFDQLLNYPNNYKFDIILHDYTLGPYLLGFVHKFNNPPIVGVTPFHNPPLTVDQIGGHYYPGYIPFHSSTYDTYMNFPQRMHNNLIYLLDTIFRRYFILPQMNELIRTKFPHDTPNLDDLQKRTVLALVNSHPAVNYPESLPPNVIEVGGLQIVEPKPLPKDLDEFMNESKNGAILFSLGTNMQPRDLGEKKIQIIIDTMSQLSQFNFMWKFDKSFIKTKLPSNILIQSFFPQRDILAHPKLKVFVTHAGGLSTQEATWRGVPMIGLALFIDQPRNLQKSIHAGVAEQVDFLTLSVESLKEAIIKVTENPIYKENMKIRSAKFRDRPMKPLDTAIWWIEYILRNPNPEHLRSPVNNIGIIASNSIDFILLLFVIFSIILWLFMKMYRLIVGFLFKSQSHGRDSRDAKKKKTK